MGPWAGSPLEKSCDLPTLSLRFLDALVDAIEHNEPGDAW